VSPHGDPFRSYHRSPPTAPRSGLAWKSFIDVGAGVIDADYRGNVGVLLFNHAETDFAVKRGDRVAQFILERIYTPPVASARILDTRPCPICLVSHGFSAIPSDLIRYHLIPIGLSRHKQVVEVDELDDTERAAGGFGSTGVKTVVEKPPLVEKEN
jgi:hypothetical protein